jgi:uncharacterized protein YndB with AHSA1/START domain
MTAEPLVIDFEVDVPAQQAFDLWALRCATWWPPSHTLSGDPAAITFEPRAGGRILEHARSGAEHEWGTVLDWQPPRRLRYRWHPFFAPEQATEVEVTFTARAGRTAVRLQQRGFEALGDAGPGRRQRTEQAWSAVAARYVDACNAASGGASVSSARRRSP